MKKYVCFICTLVLLLVSCAFGYAETTASLWPACNEVLQNINADPAYTTLVLSHPEEQKYIHEVKINANTEHPHMLASWIVSKTTNSSDWEWTNAAGYSRCSQAISDMIMLSHELQQYVLYTPVNFQSLSSLLESTNGNFQLYGFNTAYTYSDTSNATNWELCPFVILDASNQLYEGALYVYIRKIDPVDETAETITECVIADQDINYALLKLLFDGNTGIDEADMGNMQAWVELYESKGQ